MLLNEKAGVIDDIFVYHRADAASWLLVVNAANAPKDTAWLKEQARAFKVTISDRSADTCMVALQGPAARGILQALCAKIDLAAVGFHRVVETDVDGGASILCTTGYTGERGYEMLLPAGECERLWERLLAAGAAARLIPCGLAARDTLRAEACLPLYGNEIDETTDPLSAGLARAAVSLEGHDFIGRKALAALALEAPPQVLTGFEMVDTGGPPPRLPHREGRDNRRQGDHGALQPEHGKYLGMGYVTHELAAVGQPVSIVIRDSHKTARIVERPFYTSPHWR